jgi:5-dehydro-4-deoxyglucarate dehydratase
MKVIGRDSGPVRTPLTDLNENEIAELAALVTKPPTVIASYREAAE